MSTAAVPDLAAEFPILQNLHFFNHAGVSPLPRRSADALIAYANESSDQAAAAWPKWAARLKETRTRAATLLGAAEDEIAFTTSTTHGLLIVANSLAWRPGDNVVIAAGEFPANVHPWRNLAPRGVALRTVAERPDRRFDIDAFAAAIDRRTRLVSISLVQYGTGYRMPVERIAELCRERGVLLCIDGIQGVGAMPVDVNALGCDFLSADSHKWMMGPEGTGVFYVRRERIGELSTSMTGWLGRERVWEYDNYEIPLLASAARFELGAPNVGGIGAMGASLGLLLELGIGEVWRRIEVLTARTEEGVRRLGLTVASPREEGQRSGILALGREGLDTEAVARRLTERGIFVVARRGWLRISPHCYNEPGQIDALLDALADAVR